MKYLSLFMIAGMILTGCQSQKNLVENTKDVDIQPVMKGMSEPEKRGYWQQYVHYTMDVDMDVKKHQYTGKQNWFIKTIRTIL